MGLSIGEVARATGVRVPTIRYYHAVGLLPAPARTAGGQRRYGPHDVMLLSLVKGARDLGFEMSTVRELLNASSPLAGSGSPSDVVPEACLQAVDDRIGRLCALRDVLRSRPGNRDLLERMLAALDARPNMECAEGEASETVRPGGAAETPRKRLRNL